VPVTKIATQTDKINWLKGRLSWRITFAVFATIVLVQGVILYFTLKSYEQAQLSELAEMGKSAVTPVLMSADGKLITTFSAQSATRILQTTPIRGFALYDPNKMIARDVYGEPPALIPDLKNSEHRLSYLSPNKERYDVSYGPLAMKTYYAVVLRLDSKFIKDRLLEHMLETATISLLLSAFITTVLILVLGKWMLEPILILRNNLLGAAKDPRTPFRYLTAYRRRDELGSVISSANKLIKLNAENLDRLNKQANDKIYRVAFFDALTELPNRPHFLNKLQEVVDGTEQRDGYDKVGVLVIDIDHFGDVNDTLGYEAGDELLRNVSQRLTETLPDAILLARLSEDEFACIVKLPENSDEEIQVIAESVMNIFGSTFNIQGNDLVLEASAGMALWPDNATDSSDLLKKAESALDQAKQEDKGRFRLYSPSFELAVQSRIQMVRDLRIAIEEKQFALAYQPQFDAKTRNIIGAEALLRWERTDQETGKKAFVRPDHFIPVAEQSGLIVPIGRWVLEEACRFARECQTDGLTPFRIAVNLSGIQFHRDDVIALTRDVLARTGLEAHLLELEVTESAVMKDIEQTISLLLQLKDLGVELAIDDFGTGYSSLSYLKRFPVHRLKVDRSFVMNVEASADDASITKTIIQLGHSIGLNVIAEGVETAGQIEFLVANGCDEFQGYFFSKPLTPADFKLFVKNYTPKFA
jgi:diguanylate cyclase (GGDEF)-like protein